MSIKGSAIEENFNKHIGRRLNTPGMRSLFGVDLLHQGAKQAQGAWNAGRSAWTGAGGWGTKGLLDTTRKAAMPHLGELGSTAFDFFSGAGRTGWGRVGAIAARSGLAWGAMKAADFLNPFGFGSISD